MRACVGVYRAGARVRVTSVRAARAWMSTCKV